MREFLKNRSGLLYTWLTVLSVMFIVIFVFVVVTPTIDEMYDVCLDMAPDYAEWCDRLITWWKYFPVLLFGGMILAAYVRSQKTEYDTAYYQG